MINEFMDEKMQKSTKYVITICMPPESLTN